MKEEIIDFDGKTGKWIKREYKKGEWVCFSNCLSYSDIKYIGKISKVKRYNPNSDFIDYEISNVRLANHVNSKITENKVKYTNCNCIECLASEYIESLIKERQKIIKDEEKKVKELSKFLEKVRI